MDLLHELHETLTVNVSPVGQTRELCEAQICSIAAYYNPTIAVTSSTANAFSRTKALSSSSTLYHPIPLNNLRIRELSGMTERAISICELSLQQMFQFRISFAQYQISQVVSVLTTPVSAILAVPKIVKVWHKSSRK